MTSKNYFKKYATIFDNGMDVYQQIVDAFVMETNRFATARGYTLTGEFRDLLIEQNSKWNDLNRRFLLAYQDSPILKDEFINKIALVNWPFMFDPLIKNSKGKGLPLSLFYTRKE